MSGLDIENDSILQIAVIITDGKLLKRIEGPELVIHCEDAVLDTMNDWCKEHHGQSGLTQARRLLPPGACPLAPALGPGRLPELQLPATFVWCRQCAKAPPH